MACRKSGNFFTFALVFSVFCASAVNCSNILILDPVPSPSHQIWMRALAKAIGREHNVTYVSVGSPQNLGPNVTNIFMEEVYNELGRIMPPSNIVDLVYVNPLEEIPQFRFYCEPSWMGSLKSNGLDTLLNYPDNFVFDLVIHDYSCGPFYLHLAAKFNSPPIIGVSAFGFPPYTVELLGGHIPYAYIPYYALYYTMEMNFWQRAYNMLLYLAHIGYIRNFLGPLQDELAWQHINKDLPCLTELEKNKMVLGLVNMNPAVDFPLPLPPTVIPVGGLHIDRPKPLPKDLEEFVQNSVKGAVLFSLGTNVRSDTLGAEKQIELIKAIAEMSDYNFLWKFESDSLPMELPKNLIVRPFLPQNDILGHPKTRGFISHGGQLSTQESSWHGVPMIIIPFLADQHRNAHNLGKEGVSEMIAFIELTKDEVKRKVLQVLDGPTYRQKMMLRSQRFRDQPELPIERSMWWINYVLRNPNPEHLQSPVKRLGFLRANSYDIFFAFTGFVLVLLYGVYKLVSLCFGKRNVKKIKTH